MNKKCKGAVALALIMAMSMAGNSVVYAEETVPAKTVDSAKEDTTKEDAPALCNEDEHQLVESTVILPTCTEKGYSLYKCKQEGCTYEEKRDETAPLGHDLKEVSIQEATADKPGVITYKCQRQGCDYTELAEIPAKDSSTSDEDKKDDRTIESDTTKPEEKPGEDESDADNNSGHSGDKNAADSSSDGELPEEDIDEEYAAYASSTSTNIETEYDPETAVRTIRVTKKNADNKDETEEVTGMTVPTGTTEIKKDSDGNITDLAVSTAIDEIKNGFSLTSDNKKLHSIAIIDQRNPKSHWITLNAREKVSELGIRLRSESNKIFVTLTENEKTLNIINISDTEKELILTTSTGGTCLINKEVQKISVDKDGKYSDRKTLGRKNQIILNDVNGSKPYLELVYVKEKADDTSAGMEDLKSQTSKAETIAAGEVTPEGSEVNKKKDSDEELYWIQPYGDEEQEPIVITIYKK